jgi:hypothetical protein
MRVLSVKLDLACCDLSLRVAAPIASGRQSAMHEGGAAVAEGALIAQCP